MANETTTTESKYEIAIYDGNPEYVDAEYYQFEDGWIHFKDSRNRAVFSITGNKVDWIKKLSTNNRVVTVTLKANTSDYVASMEAAAKATKKLRDTRGI